MARGWSHREAAFLTRLGAEAGCQLGTQRDPGKKGMNIIIKTGTIMEHSRTRDVEQNIGWWLLNH